MGPAATLFARLGDRLLMAVFLGMAVIGAVLLAWSLAAPVGPLAFAFCAAATLAGVIAQAASRASVLKTRNELSPAALGICLVLTVLFAERSTVAGDLNDAGGYHVGIVRWLSEYGTVHGMALIHDRLGFVSSWFAWSAVFNHGDLAGRIGTMMNGFLLLLCLAQLMLVTLRIWRNRIEAPDFLVLLAWLILLPSFLRWDMRSSPSPDLPVLVYGIVIVWAILIIESQAAPDCAASRGRFMVLLIGMGAFLVKLSAAPLLAAGGLYFVFARRQGRAMRLAIAGFAGAIFLGILALAGLVSSGCMFFPLPWLCLDLPWSVGHEGAQRTASVIRNFALGNLDQPQVGGTALLAAWIHNNGDAARWIGLSAIAAIPLVLRRNQMNVPGIGWAAIVSVVGLPYFLIMAPALRFGWSYLVILPLLALITVRAPLAAFLYRLAPNPVARRGIGIAVTIVGVIHVTAPLYKEVIDAKFRAKSYESIAHRKQGDPAVNAFNAHWWLVPNQYADLPGFTTERAGDFDYAIPPRSTSLCWHHALPCSSDKLADVRLRDASVGLSAGFQRPPGGGGANR